MTSLNSEIIQTPTMQWHIFLKACLKMFQLNFCWVSIILIPPSHKKCVSQGTFKKTHVSFSQHETRIFIILNYFHRYSIFKGNKKFPTNYLIAVRVAELILYIFSRSKIELIRGIKSFATYLKKNIAGKS